jgi:5-carboxymethyl-2-hydroxymuconate isomerase
MPHIIVEHPSSFNRPKFMEDMLVALHRALAEQPTVDKARIKTRAIESSSSVLGVSEHNGNYIHITLKLLPREPALRKAMATVLLATARNFVPDDCAVTVEVQQLDPESYSFS